MVLIHCSLNRPVTQSKGSVPPGLPQPDSRPEKNRSRCGRSTPKLLCWDRLSGSRSVSAVCPQAPLVREAGAAWALSLLWLRTLLETGALQARGSECVWRYTPPPQNLPKPNLAPARLDGSLSYGCGDRGRWLVSPRGHAVVRVKGPYSAEPSRVTLRFQQTVQPAAHRAQSGDVQGQGRKSPSAGETGTRQPSGQGTAGPAPQLAGPSAATASRFRAEAPRQVLPIPDEGEEATENPFSCWSVCPSFWL